MGTKNVSLKMIAAKCGCSINTVSHALRDMDDVSDSLKSLIRKTAMELGYMPNHVAQSARKDEKPVVALVIDYIDSFVNLYFNIFINELMKIFSEKNEYGFSFIYEKEFNKEVVKQCIVQRIDLIVTHKAPSEETLEYAKLNNIQIILAGDSPLSPNMDVVSVDNVMGGKLAARYLRNFHNNNKYVYVGNEYFISDQRYAAFKNELSSFEDEYDLKFFNPEKEELNVLYQYIIDGYRSLFFYNDLMAYRILEGLDKIAVDIRRAYPDLHLIGFDGLCKYIPGLKDITSVGIDFEKFAAVTYRVISNRLRNFDSRKERVVLPVSIRRRNG